MARNLIILSIALVAMFSVTTGLKCYYCRGDMNSYCAQNYTASKIWQTECSEDSKCGLIKEEYKSGSGNIVRSCLPPYEDGCHVDADYLGYKKTICACSEPLCNGAGVRTPPTGVVLSAMAALLVCCRIIY